MIARLTLFFLLVAATIAQSQDGTGLSDSVVETLSDAPARDTAVTSAPQAPASTPYPQSTRTLEISSEQGAPDPVTAGWIETLRDRIEPCWLPPRNAPRIVVGVELSPQGRVDAQSISLLATDGEGGDATSDAYASARRAILRCQGNGFDFPQADYEVWQDLEITFAARTGQP